MSEEKNFPRVNIWFSEKNLLALFGEFWLPVVFFFTGLLIRLYDIDRLPLDKEEIMTVIRINHPVFETINLLKHSQFPPLHYVLLNIWTDIVGVSEWSLRFPSAIFSSLTVVAIYKLGKELFSKDVGLIAALLLMFSPFAIGSSQHAKMYALFWFLNASSFYFFFRFIRDNKNSSLGACVLTTVLSCYTMYTGYVFLVVQSIIFIFLVPRERWSRWFGTQLIVFLFCVPWLALFLSSGHEIWPDTRVDSFDYLGFFMQFFFILIGASYNTSTSDHWLTYFFNVYSWRVNAFLYVFLMMFYFFDLFEDSLNARRKRLQQPNYRLAILLWLITSGLLCIVAYLFIPKMLLIRYVGFLHIPFFLMISSPFAKLSVWFRVVLMGVLLCIALNHATNHFANRNNSNPGNMQNFTQEMNHENTFSRH